GQGLRILRTRFGVRLLLCEGGSRLTHDLVAGGFLDEIFLTLAPKLGGDSDALRMLEGPPFRPDALPRAELLHVLLEGSELFLRYRLKPEPVPLADPR
ncbi:MAG TPA: dihydrofolate reductase family protein, partial [Chloroflexota bacterium]|nr:dihydrofolate reductase family protein [Chloroflexota bacterium]